MTTKGKTKYELYMYGSDGREILRSGHVMNKFFKDDTKALAFFNSEVERWCKENKCVQASWTIVNGGNCVGRFTMEPGKENGGDARI